MDQEKLNTQITANIATLHERFYISKPAEASRVQNAIDNAWNLYAGALSSFINGGNMWPNLQLVTLSDLEQKLNWDDPTFGDYYFHKVTADLINGQGATYNKTNRSFAERYGAFINDISVPPVNQAALDQATAALTKLINDNTRHSGLIENLNLEWVAYDTSQRNNLPSSLWKSFDQWWTDSGSSENYKASLQLNLAYFQNYENLIQEAYNGGANIAQILKSYDPSTKRPVKMPANSSNSQIAGIVEVFTYQISEDYPTWLQNAKSGALARTALIMDENSFRSDVTNTSIAGGIGFGFGFFGVIAGAQRNTTNINTQTINFSLELEGVFNTFNILPNGWYNSTAFGLYKQGPFVPNSPTDHLAETCSLFGPNGFFNFMSSQAIVVYAPKVTLKFSEEDYHYFDQVTQGFAAFCIGPFAIGGGSYYDHQTTITRDDPNYSFSFQINDYAILLAFNSEQIY